MKILSAKMERFELNYWKIIGNAAEAAKGAASKVGEATKDAADSAKSAAG